MHANSLQRGQSAKHARSKSTTTPTNNLHSLSNQLQQNSNNNTNALLPPSIPNDQLLHSQKIPQQLHYYQLQQAQPQQQQQLQQSLSGYSSNIHPGDSAYPAQPKRTLKPKDLNNYSIQGVSAATTASRKCGTPIDQQDPRKKQQQQQQQLQQTRPTSKEYRKPNNKPSNQNSSPEKQANPAQSLNVSNPLGYQLSGDSSSSRKEMNSGKKLVGNSSQQQQQVAKQHEFIPAINHTNQYQQPQQPKKKTASMFIKNVVPLPKKDSNSLLQTSLVHPASVTNHGSYHNNNNNNSNNSFNNGIVQSPQNYYSANTAPQLIRFSQQQQQQQQLSSGLPQQGYHHPHHQHVQQQGYIPGIVSQQQQQQQPQQPHQTRQVRASKSIYQQQQSSDSISPYSQYPFPLNQHQRSSSHQGTQLSNTYGQVPGGTHSGKYTVNNHNNTYISHSNHQLSSNKNPPKTLSLSFSHKEEDEHKSNISNLQQLLIPLRSSLTGANQTPINPLSIQGSHSNSSHLRKKPINTGTQRNQSQQLQVAGAFPGLQPPSLQVDQQLLPEKDIEPWVLALNNEKATDLLSKGKAAFKENSIEEAQKYFSDALKEEPMLLESQYLLGICHLQTQQYQKAVDEFCDLLYKNEHFKKNVYLLIAIAYKKTNVTNAAIQILGKAIQQNPKYYDAYFYRGKFQVKMKRYDKAMADFDVAIKLNPSCGLGYLGKADCLRLTEQYDKAIEMYTLSLAKEEVTAKTAILKRAIAYTCAEQYDKALSDLETILAEDPCNSEAFYFKGSLFLKQRNINEAILSFEQSIKHNNSRKAVTKAIYDIAKIKIEMRDFYQAYHTLQRADYLDVDQKALEKFKLFTDGVTFLMKRKHEDGIKNLTVLVKTQTLGDFLKPLVYSYRAYGYFCLGKHQKALNDLQFIETFSKLDKASTYNKLICEGIISAGNNQFEQAMNHFSKASKQCPQKMEPFFYKAMTLVRFANKLIPKTEEAKQTQFRQNALKNLDKGIELNETNYNIFYHRGLLKFSLGMIEESIEDFNLAIEKADEGQAKLHYARGIAYACCMHFKYAIQELTNAMRQQPNLANAYLNRAKCFHLVGEKSSAFLDLQKYSSMKQNDPKIHLWVGNLLFNIGEYPDAIKTYSYAIGEDKDCEILLLRTKCFIISKELNLALEDLEKIIQQANENTNNGISSQNLAEIASYDKYCLQSLKTAYQSAEISDFEEQSKLFNQALALINHTKAIFAEGSCFKKSDVLFFKGVYYFYLKDYQKALKKFKQSFELKSELINKPKAPEKTEQQQKNENIEDLDEEGINHQAQLLNEYEFNNRTYNVFEFYFNCAACYIMMKDYDQAFSFLLQLQAILPEEEEIIKRIEILFQIINDEQEQSRATFEKIDEAALNDINNLEFFPKNHRLCSIFPSVSTDFKIYKDFKINLYFCLPTVEPPSMKPHFDESLLEGLQPTVVENKPEAPWIRRTSEGIIFTDNVQIFEDLDLKTETARESDAGADAQQKLNEATAGDQQENIIDSQKFQVDLKDKANVAEYKNQRDNNNAVPSRGRKNEFDYVELMNDHSHYLYQDYKDIDYSCDGEEAVFKNSPQQIEKDKLKEFLKLDDNIEKKLAKLQQKNQKQ